MLDLNYKKGISDLVKLIRRQPILPSKHAETKITLESKKHTIAPRGFSNSGSVRMDNDNGSIGRSEPDKSRGGTSRRENSSVASWGDIEKQSKDRKSVV